MKKFRLLFNITIALLYLLTCTRAQAERKYTIPTISATLSISASNTRYGTPSPASRFEVSGINMADHIVATAPAGFELSMQAGSGFAGSISIGSAGAIAPTSLYIRLAASAGAGTYAGNVTLTSSGAVSVTRSVGLSAVDRAPLTITAADTSKTYGFLLSSTAGSTAFSSKGLQNSDSIGSMSIHFALGAPSGAIPFLYRGQVSVDAPAGGIFTSSNYDITLVPGNISVLRAPLIIFAHDTTKLFGTTLSYTKGSTAFSAMGLQNSDFIESVTLSFGTGASAGTLPGEYSETINIFNPVGSRFPASDYVISYSYGSIFVDSVAAVITLSGQIPGVTGVYGSASAAQSFMLSASPLLSALIATAPAGYELSLIDSAAYGPVLTIPYSVNLAPVPVFIRLVQGLAVGTYPGTICLSTSGIHSVCKVLAPGIVGRATLNISADSIPRLYGTVLSGAITSTGFTVHGIMTGQKITSVRMIPDSAGLSAGTCAGSAFSIIPSAATGSGGFLTSNYTIIYKGYTGSVHKIPLSIIPDNKTRDFGQPDPLFTAVFSGFVNGDTQAVLSPAPVFTTNETGTSLPGTYIIQAGGAGAKNYTFLYGTGHLTVAGLPPPPPPVIPVMPVVPVTPVTPVIPVTPVTPVTPVIPVIPVTPAPVLSTDAGLADLTMNGVVLSPLFLTSVTAYAALVENKISTITVFPVLAGLHATLRVNGMQATSGMTINLLTGDNRIAVEVTAQDGLTQKLYSIIVHRSVAPDAVSATNLLSPNGDGKNDTWIVKDIGLYPKNTVTVFDLAGRIIYTRKGYKNEWNASYKGAALMNGTYFYMIDLGIGGPAIKGFITVLTPR